MIDEIIIDANGQSWRVKAKNKEAAINEIAHARVTGSVGSSSKIDRTLMGGEIEFLAEVHKIDANGKDILPS